jgi:hypothetical protein
MVSVSVNLIKNLMTKKNGNSNKLWVIGKTVIKIVKNNYGVRIPSNGNGIIIMVLEILKQVGDK